MINFALVKQDIYPDLKTACTQALGFVFFSKLIKFILMSFKHISTKSYECGSIQLTYEVEKNK